MKSLNFPQKGTSNEEAYNSSVRKERANRVQRSPEEKWETEVSGVPNASKQENTRATPSITTSRLNEVTTLELQ